MYSKLTVFNMRIWISCTVVLLVLNTASAINPARKGCNYKRLDMLDAEITNVGSFMDKRKTYLEVVEKKGKRVLSGILAFTRDMPLNADIKWDVFAIDENNQATRKAEAKKTNFCSYLVQQKPLADMLINHSNLSSTCPYKKGTYKIFDAEPDTRLLPCKAPGNANNWDCTIKVTEGLSGKVIFEMLHKYQLIR